MFWEEPLWNVNIFTRESEEETELKEVGKVIERLYRRYGENELFRTEFEAFLVRSLERTEGRVEVFRELFSKLPVSKKVKEELLEDLEEAYKTLEMKREIEKRAPLLKERLKKLCR